jgi:hypothetical protein
MNQTTKKPGYVTCPVCNKYEVALTPSGKIHKHKNISAGRLIGRRTVWPICKASGTVPQ